MKDAEPTKELSQEQQNSLYLNRGRLLSQQTLNVLRALLNPQTANTNNPINYDNLGENRREVLEAVIDSNILNESGKIRSGRRVNHCVFTTTTGARLHSHNSSTLSCTVSMVKRDSDPPSGEYAVKVDKVYPIVKTSNRRFLEPIFN